MGGSRQAAHPSPPPGPSAAPLGCAGWWPGTGEGRCCLLQWPPCVASVECKGVTSGLYRRVFLPEDFRIYTDGRGGLAKSELAHIEVIVMPCVLHPTSLRTEQLWGALQEEGAEESPLCSSALQSLALPQHGAKQELSQGTKPIPWDHR